MKKLIASLTLILVIACPWASFGQASIEKEPAYLPIDKVFDLKANPPEVNVNIPRFLLNDAISGLSETNLLKESGIDLQDLFKDVKLIRVVIIEANKNNRQTLDTSAKTLQKELDAKWTPVVQLSDSEVNVYALGDAKGESTAGLALLIHDEESVIIANVVGHVPLAKILNIASKNNKGMLKTLNKTLKTMTSDEELETLNKTIKPLLSNTEQPSANKPKSTGSASTNHPAAKEPASKP